MSVLSPTDKLIRKLRKKLRQIENLEFLGRSNLNEEELLKVKQKNATRIELAKLLKQSEEGCMAFTPGIGTHIPTSTTDQSESIPTTIITPENKTKHGPKNQFYSISYQPLKLPETMKRPTPEEDIPSLSPESSASSDTQSKKPKPESSTPDKPNKIKSKMHNTAGKSPVQKSWHETPFLLNILESHNDIVSCVDLDETHIISGSRDTLVQVWCATTGSALMDLRGHTNTVTCVSLLSVEDSKHLNAELSGSISEDTGPRLALTGSLDCCIKLWNIENGSALRSIYTFSGVTALCYSPSHSCCVVGSEGGKLETYTFLEESTNPRFSIKTFEDSVSHIKLQNENLICSSLDGFISVWSMKGTELSRLFRSDDLVPETGHVIRCRPILSLAVNSAYPTIFYGDEGATVKMLTWKTGCVKKLRNHVYDFGITNAIFATQSFLLSSSINLDTGVSSINIRSLPECNYLGSLNVSGIERIFCLAATEDQNDKSLRLIVGGTQLMLLETRKIGCRRSPKKDSLLKPHFINEFTLPAGDSEDDFSSSSEEEIEEDEDEPANSNETVNANESSQRSSWCTIPLIGYRLAYFVVRGMNPIKNQI
ncbi:LOW QUALITY PROTEIN: lissencephaly-1 homolog [Daphnia magna]|uniref:LOW QUALITY PROTEIN: lissencephaly-1 homolog n=1 Tax=Daphnia magna TaxID=35525 RepID=UPI001E1BA111|nr:LOW QUALITY PROTEIN: lissencephaly-1 homolog [Daphnia magna]